jgi:hypothetical protein
MTGLTNHREYYTEHYFAELLSGDLKDTLDRWKADADVHPDSEDHREPPARLRSLAQPYFRALEKSRRSPEALAESQRDFLATLLPALGYAIAPAWRALGHGSAAVRIPLLGEITTQSGAPALWLIEALPTDTSDDDLAASPLSLTPLPSQYAADPQNLDPQLPGRPLAGPKMKDEGRRMKSGNEDVPLSSSSAPTGRHISAQGNALVLINIFGKARGIARARDWGTSSNDAGSGRGRRHPSVPSGQRETGGPHGPP